VLDEVLEKKVNTPFGPLGIKEGVNGGGGAKRLLKKGKRKGGVGESKGKVE